MNVRHLKLRLAACLVLPWPATGGRVLPPTGLDLAAAGLAVLPGALNAEQLASLNVMVDAQVARLHLAVAGLGKAELKGFCFGDVIERGRGKYELRVRGIGVRPDDGGLPDFLLMGQWLPLVAGALGPNAELRSVTVILSMAMALGTAEAAVSQPWHSDGSLPPDDFALPAYALVVYIPLRSVPPNGGRVEYLLTTHTNRSARVERSNEPWSATWGVDVVTPEMGAGDAVVYSYTTQHRGLKSEVLGHRPVLKLDYFMPGVGTRKPKDGWCEQTLLS